jgi:hypothetical protein
MNTPMKDLVGRLAMVFALTATSGCATARTLQPDWEGTPEVRPEQILISVENQIWNDVVIYSQAYGSKIRLGTVTTGQTENFRLPQHQRFAPNLELMADPIGSPRPIPSGPVVAAPGQEVRWVIHENAAVRALTIW